MAILTAHERTVARRAGRTCTPGTLARLEPLYRRHDAAMRVVATIWGEPDRWTLLGYVVAGSPAIDAALAA